MQRRHLARLLTLAAPAPVLPGCATPAPGEAGTWFIFLETGRPAPDDEARVDAMQRGHIDNFKRLFALGQLTAAGPLRDPSGHKRGIVTVKARSSEELLGYFQPDAYVREGYMAVNAVPATPHRALKVEGIDASRIEELRIVLIARGTLPADGAQTRARQAFLQGLLDQGRVGAWYTLHQGPTAEVLFARSKDSPQLESAFAAYPGLGQPGVSVAVWGQWLSPGAVP